MFNQAWILIISILKFHDNADSFKKSALHYFPTKV